MSEYGDMVITRTEHGLHVDQADDDILIATELLDELDDQHVAFDGQRITVYADNGTYVYEVGGTPPGYPHCRVAHRAQLWGADPATPSASRESLREDT